jgi:hypothetical protein
MPPDFAPGATSQELIDSDHNGDDGNGYDDDDIDGVGGDGGECGSGRAGGSAFQFAEQGV